jgi:hypothetical protein
MAIETKLHHGGSSLPDEDERVKKEKYETET